MSLDKLFEKEKEKVDLEFNSDSSLDHPLIPVFVDLGKSFNVQFLDVKFIPSITGYFLESDYLVGSEYNNTKLFQEKLKEWFFFDKNGTEYSAEYVEGTEYSAEYVEGYTTKEIVVKKIKLFKR